MGKIVSILLVVAAAYFLLFRGKKNGAAKRNRIEEAARKATEAQAKRRGIAVDTHQCKVCDSYVASGANPCERPDCPLTIANAQSKP